MSQTTSIASSDNANTQPTQVAVANDISAKPKKKVNYLNNKDMLAEVIASKQRGEMSNELAKMLMTLSHRYAMKGCYINYSFNEDMRAYAQMMLVRTWKSFDPNKSSNPFAFFTQCIKNSFIQFLQTEKKYRTMKDEVLIDLGFNPSHTYTTEYELNERGDMSSDVQHFSAEEYSHSEEHAADDQ